MKKIQSFWSQRTLRILLAGCLISGALSASDQAQAQEGGSLERSPIAAAVLDFQGSSEIFRDKGKDIAILLNAELSKNLSLILVERQELAAILGEQELGKGGFTTPESAARVGCLTGAKVLITGRAFTSGSTKGYIVAKVISTETGRVFGETVSFDMGTSMMQPQGNYNLDSEVSSLAGRINSIIAQNSTVLLAKAEKPDERLARLAKLVEGKKLPRLIVSVSEKHIQGSVPDPAAQTELIFYLQKLGFSVNTTDSTEGDVKQPTINISGEAFSERGAQRGGLVASRARVEIQITRLSDGKLLGVDRQADVAVDVAEYSAGKAALENAARRLLDRIVPKLIEK